jgi:hypothetical protein
MVVTSRVPTTHGIGLSTVSASIYTLFGSVAMQPAVSYLFVMLIDGGVSPQKRRLAKSHLLRVPLQYWTTRDTRVIICS